MYLAISGFYLQNSSTMEAGFTDVWSSVIKRKPTVKVNKRFLLNLMHIKAL